VWVFVLSYLKEATVECVQRFPVTGFQKELLARWFEQGRE
jgi:hypothetical protein